MWQGEWCTESEFCVQSTKSKKTLKTFKNLKNTF